MATKTKAEPVTITPKALAEELEISPKRLRSYLRTNFPRKAELKNSAWVLDQATADAVREQYTASSDQDES